MSLTVSPIAADICVAPQLTPDAMAEVARQGFRSVVNNRPDFEGGADQPTSARIEAAAIAAGLVYRYLPVAGNYQSPEEIAAFAALAAEPAAAAAVVLPLGRALDQAVLRSTGAGVEATPARRPTARLAPAIRPGHHAPARGGQ